MNKIYCYDNLKQLRKYFPLELANQELPINKNYPDEFTKYEISKTLSIGLRNLLNLNDSKNIITLKDNTEPIVVYLDSHLGYYIYRNLNDYQKNNYKQLKKFHKKKRFSLKHLFR